MIFFAVFYVILLKGGKNLRILQEKSAILVKNNHTVQQLEEITTQETTARREVYRTPYWGKEKNRSVVGKQTFSKLEMLILEAKREDLMDLWRKPCTCQKFFVTLHPIL